MSRFRSAVLISLAMLVLAAPAAHARYGMPHEKSFHIGLGGGLSVPTADAKDALKNGYNGQAWASFTPFMLPITIRAAVDFQKHDISKVTTTTTGPSPTTTTYKDGTNQILAGLANVRLDLMRGFLRPYISLGLGGYNVKTEATGPGTLSSGGTSTAEAPSNTKTGFGVNGGAGLALRLGAIHLYVEGRVDNVYTDKGLIDTKTVQVIPVTFGLSY